MSSETPVSQWTITHKSSTWLPMRGWAVASITGLREPELICDIMGCENKVMMRKEVCVWEESEFAREIKRWNMPLPSWLHFDHRHEGRISQSQQAQAEFLVLARY